MRTRLQLHARRRVHRAYDGNANSSAQAGNERRFHDFRDEPAYPLKLAVRADILVGSEVRHVQLHPRAAEPSREYVPYRFERADNNWMEI